MYLRFVYALQICSISEIKRFAKASASAMLLASV
jgi:hypothetical protein